MSNYVLSVSSLPKYLLGRPVAVQLMRSSCWELDKPTTDSPALLALSGVDAGGGLIRQLVHVVASIGGSVQRISICPQV